MSRITRRSFLKLGAAAAAGTMLPARWSWGGSGGPPFRLSWGADDALAYYRSQGLAKFVQPLRGVGPGGIPVAAPDTVPQSWWQPGVTHYSIGIRQFTDQLHPALDPTRLWGYNPIVPLGGGIQSQRHLGGIIVAHRDNPVQITFINNLPPKHILPIDRSANFPDAKNKPDNRVSTHLHGGKVPWPSDGGPMAWWTPGGMRGMSFENNSMLGAPGINNRAEFYYPNQQSARMMWYHDHAHDITRQNAYAGIATAYILRDAFESDLRNMGLPDFVENGGREIPLVIQDKVFVGDDIDVKDPTWEGLGLPTSVGSLWYPHVYELSRWGPLGPHPKGTPPNPSSVPEMFGDTMLANGTVFPHVTVEARRYRFRILNACQARFLNLQLYVDDGSRDSITLDSNYDPTNAKGPNFFVIGTEGGFLARPVRVLSNQPFDPVTLSGSLITGPAERWDVIVDFSGFAGKKIVLYNDAPAPFPEGDPMNDFFPGAPGNPVVTKPGLGPNTRQIMRFKVVPATSADPPLKITPYTDLTKGLDPFLVPMTTHPLAEPAGVKVRHLTLNEGFDGYGRLIQLEGTNVAVSPGNFGRAYMDPATETPKAGATEVWKIANLTGDTHPIHFHLVNVQILSRQPFDAEHYNGSPRYTGQARGPELTELGWKETVKMHPGEVTTVIMKFDLPTVPFTIPASPRTGGHEYVWHCHILDHEEHDMMRPLIVT